MKTLNGKAAIEFAFQAWKGNVVFFLGVVAIVFVLNYVIPQVLFQSISHKGSLLLNIVSWLLSSYAALGLVVIGLRVVDKQPVAYKDFFGANRAFGPYLFASVIASFTIGLGLVFLVVPGIIIAVMWMFYSYLIIDKSLHPIDSFKQSMAMTKGFRWQLSGMLVLLALINFAGILLFGLGLIVTIPITAITMAHMYRQLSAV